MHYLCGAEPSCEASRSKGTAKLKDIADTSAPTVSTAAAAAAIATATTAVAATTKLALTAAQTATLSSYAGAATTALGYEILATEYLEKPIGFSTVVGITSGYWANGAGYGAANGGYVNTGVAVTQYVIRVEDVNQMAGIQTGDFVKLPGHSMGPDFTDGVTPARVADTETRGLDVQSQNMI